MAGQSPRDSVARSCCSTNSLFVRSVCGIFASADKQFCGFGDPYTSRLHHMGGVALVTIVSNAIASKVTILIGL